MAPQPPRRCLNRRPNRSTPAPAAEALAAAEGFPAIQGRARRNSTSFRTVVPYAEMVLNMPSCETRHLKRVV